MIVLDADGRFAGIFNKIFQETLLIKVHAFESGKHKEMRNEGLRKYFN